MIDIPNDILGEIYEAFESYFKTQSYVYKNITFSEIFQRDAVNYELVGSINTNEKIYYFHISDGNTNGTEIKYFSEEYKEVNFEHIYYKFVPQDDNLETNNPALYSIYLKWQKQDWFKKLEKDYNYDIYFSPTNETQSYYRNEAKSRGLKIVTELT